MEKILPAPLPEVIFSSSVSSISKQISRLEKAGKIKKIAARVYTSNLKDKPAEIIGRNLFLILGNLYPGSVMSHRSAFEFKPTETGNIFITHTYTKKVSLPGIVIHFLEGHGPIEGDNPLSGELFVSQRERAFLENLQSSRKPGPESKTLTLPEIEEKLEQIIRVNGEAALNSVRERAKEIAAHLGWQREFEKLNKMISALLSTRPSHILTSPVARARAFGVPYDPVRLQLFEKLFIALKQKTFPYRPEKNITNKAFRNFAFFESYFSNYIEGTVFEIEEAKQIIATQRPLPARNEDSHDILGTYQIVSDKEEISKVPSSSEEILQILQYRHKVMLAAREEKKPGMFKDKNNFAGNTAFVDFNLVRGTLIKGFDFYRALDHPFAKSTYIMFMVSEVHPFLDGNGRIARMMMNAELAHQNQSKIIIPTVYRDDYMLTLRKLTRQSDPAPYIKMLAKAHEFSATVYGDEMYQMQQILERSNAFLEHTEGKLKIL